MHSAHDVIATRVILFGVVLAQLVDAVTFTIGVSRYGIELESNGFAAFLFQVGGLGAVLWAKAIVLLTVLAVLVLTADRFPRLLVWGGAAATSIGLLGFATNSLSLVILA